MRRTLLYVRALVFLFLSQLSLPLAASALDKVRSWSHQRVMQELEKNHLDMNLVSSFALPLSADAVAGGKPAYTVLLAMQRRLTGIDVASLSCHDLTDYLLISAFFSQVDLHVPNHTATQRLFDCLESATLFDIANSLIFICGFTTESHQNFMPGGVTRLQLAQGDTGGFIDEKGKSSYYLTTHALFALYLCKGGEQSIAQARQRLIRSLPVMAQYGFVDGVAESLIFLRWTGGKAPTEKVFLSWLLAQIQENGAICAYLKASNACQPHWHPASLLYYILL